ncbi:MAG: D-alanine--D-alanine ligase [Lachnospiraceae bacterium]|nr:D-alanine--D-alanine ligase [Lachnospiraceae bacterium]
MEKKTIAVFFGGESSEHEVSCKSVQNVAKNIDGDLYDILFVGITKEGRWVYVDSIDYIEDGTWADSDISAELSPDAEKQCIILTSPDGSVEDVFVDVAFPVLHGKYGEDGTIQGLLELSHIPYVGCGVLASAVSMDKFFTKIIVDSIGVRQAKFVGLHDYEFLFSEEDREKCMDRVEASIPYPVFVKPSCAGSSCGVSKAANREELEKALIAAAEVDSKILCEEFIKGREVECAVIGGGRHGAEASGVGEILAAAEFYDYDAKYNNPDSVTDTDPDIPSEIKEEIRKAAVDIFNAVGGYGLSRVDFFIKEDGTVIFNEINTMPGFTPISMYPMLWAAKGMDKKALVSKLIELAYYR